MTPTANTRDWPELDGRHLWHPYTQHATAPTPIPISRGSGAYLYDRSGNVTSREVVSNGVSTATICPNDDYDALNRPKTWKHIAPGFEAVSH